MILRFINPLNDEVDHLIFKLKGLFNKTLNSSMVLTYSEMTSRNYNKLIISIVISVVSILICQVNNINAQNTGIGFKAGLDFSTQLNNFQFTSGELELDLDPSFTTGYHLGLIYRNRVSPNIRIQTEPSFLKIGAKYQESFTFRGFDFETDSESKLSYIQLPVLIELTTTPPDLEEFPKPWEETTYHLTFGLYGSYLLDATFSGVNSGNPIGVDFEEEFSNDVTSQFNDFDAGVIVGGGLEYGYQNKIGIETRLMLGLLNSNNANSTEFKPNNLSISVAMYYLF